MKIHRLQLLVFLVLAGLYSTSVSAQEKLIKSNQVDVYISAGLSLQLGSHQKRLGLNISGIVGRPYANFTFQYYLLYTFEDFGYYEKSFQHIIGAEIGAAFDERNTVYRPRTDSPLANEYFYEFYYLYRFYLNDWNTQQPTGEIGLNFGHFFLKHENDLLAAKSVDKFRTAAMKIGYQDSVQMISTSFMFWTGNKDDPNTIRIDSSSFSKYGYFDLSETRFGKYSHGVLSFDYMRELNFGNHARASIGYDHEKVRDIIQNKFMHDLPIWPRKWNTAKSRHVPMVDNQGDAFLYQENQELRPGRFYWSLSFNPTEFY